MQSHFIIKKSKRSDDSHSKAKLQKNMLVMSLKSGLCRVKVILGAERKARQTEEEVGKQHQRMDGPGFHQVPEGSGEQGKMKETGCEIFCGAPTTLAVKE